ncbi:MAG: signal recognition particle-docking protein FtsY [Chloroflexota bacterium]|nr:signal recognition particle-docking protein FtsY [Dehalococcoidia bacterium]MDW8253642.1 signal recognition particle-docking protein FtsY [Chloroflexota bacterium]
MFERLRKIDFGLRRTRDAVFQRVAAVFERRQIDDAFWEALEETLISADLSLSTTEELLSRLRERVREEGITDAHRAKQALQEEMSAVLREVEEEDDRPFEREPRRFPDGRPFVLLIVGVNGTGKTTTIAKLAHRWHRQGKRVLIGAADTFRAAAIEQLKVWADRIGVQVVAHQPGADPGAVAYDAVEAGRSRGADVVIIDTAGRLHAKTNLMEELRKIRRVIAKVDPTAPHQVLLVIDATTGQNGILQTEAFAQAADIDGIVLTKLDGTAKGGIAFTIANELGLPIRYLGTGEQLDDLVDFDPAEYVRQLFE